MRFAEDHGSLVIKSHKKTSHSEPPETVLETILTIETV